MKIRGPSIDRIILTLLEERSGYVSGEDLSRKAGVSRAAVWKRIQVLRSRGYRIPAKPRLGYTLSRRPDHLLAWEIERKLETRKIGSEIRTFDEVTSTNEVAYEMALQGAREGLVVIAESQARGRGRIKRTWVSPPLRNLYLSVILRPQIPPQLAPLLTYAGAVATAEALRTSFSLEAELKWPNDILVRGKKLAGLLNEVKAETDRIDFVILGFGVNLNMGMESFPQELREKATSVMMELGRRVSRVEFTQSLLKSIETWYEAFLFLGAPRITEQWEAMARIRGKPIEVRFFDRVYRGVAEGLDRDGALILREKAGGRVRIVAGDLSEAPRS